MGDAPEIRDEAGHANLTIPRKVVERIFQVSLLVAIPLCLYLWRAHGVMIWLAISGASLIVFGLTDAGFQATRNHAANSSSTQRDRETLWYVGGLVIVGWVVLAGRAGWDWLRGGYHLLIGFGLLMVVSVSITFFRTAKHFLDKCGHGIRRRADGSRVCEQCDRIDREQAEHYRAERDKTEKEKLERRRLIQERALAALHELDQLKRLDPFVFEDLVLLTYERLGWTTVRSGKRTGDGGIDGVVMRNGATFIIQCKRFVTGDVGSPLLRDLLGTVVKHKANGGVLITTTGFSKEARAWCNDLPQLELVDGHQLLSMIRNAFGSASAIPARFAIALQRSNDLCSPCPKCGDALRIVEGRHGSFIGCRAYPNCRWTCSLHEFVGPEMNDG